MSVSLLCKIFFANVTKTTFKGVFRVVTLHRHETLKHISLPPLVQKAPHFYLCSQK